MDEKVKLLMEELDCDKAQAEMLLQMSGGDIEEAIRYLEKNRWIIVFQAKFWLKLRHIYGLFFCLIEPDKKNVYRSNLVFAYNPEVYTTNLNDDWLNWDRQIYHFRLEGADEEKTRQYNLAILEVVRKNLSRLIPEESKNLAEQLRQIFPADDQPVVEVAIKEINLAEYRLRPASQKEENFLAVSDFVPIVLDVSVVKDDTGVPAENLAVGDLIWVEITDHRDIAYYLAHLLSGREKDVVVPLSVPIRQIFREDVSGKTSLRIEVSFTGWIRGQATLDLPAKVRIERKENWKNL